MADIQQTMRDNFERLAVLFGGSLEDLPEAAKSQSPGFMDAHFDRLHHVGSDRITVAIAHYYRVNGDSVPDPDMEMVIDRRARTVEALTFQDARRYDCVYDDGCADEQLSSSLNDFLNLWLSNLSAQGHQFRRAA